VQLINLFVLSGDDLPGKLLHIHGIPAGLPRPLTERTELAGIAANIGIIHVLIVNVKGLIPVHSGAHFSTGRTEIMDGNGFKRFPGFSRIQPALTACHPVQ
jgi:hypothetical protein